jgi:nucleotide-binding universal stress UspA family protein
VKRFKNILYILDGTMPKHLNSAERVAKLARQNEASVSAFIVDETTLLDELSLKISGRYNEIKQAILQQNTINIDRFLSHELWSGLDVRAEYSETSGFISIIQKVLRDKHDLVIKEETLDHGLDQLTMRLVRKCPCPVWVIKRSSENFRRIFAAIDVGEDSLEARALNKKIIELTHSLAENEHGEAHYLHAWELEHESMLTSPRFKVSPEEICEMKEKLNKKRMEELNFLLKETHIRHKTDNIHLREGKIEDVIKKGIVDLKIDVVVMGSLARSGIPGLLIGNQAEKTLNNIKCTVLIVKPDGFVSPVKL